MRLLYSPISYHLIPQVFCFFALPFLLETYNPLACFCMSVCIGMSVCVCLCAYWWTQWAKVSGKLQKLCLVCQLRLWFPLFLLLEPPRLIKSGASPWFCWPMNGASSVLTGVQYHWYFLCLPPLLSQPSWADGLILLCTWRAHWQKCKLEWKKGIGVEKHDGDLPPSI